MGCACVFPPLSFTHSSILTLPLPQLIPPADRDERLAFYANHNIGWVARPKHDASPAGFKRAGRFKKASNMNYALGLSLKAERHLEGLIAGEGEARVSTSTAPGSQLGHAGVGAGGYGMQYQHRDGDDMGVGVGAGGDEDLEEKALGMAIEEMWEESGRLWRPWAANGRATRLGEIVLLVDSDTVVPEVSGVWWLVLVEGWRLMLVWGVGLFEGCGEGDEGVSDCCDYSARVWWVVFLVCCAVCLG